MYSIHLPVSLDIEVTPELQNELSEERELAGRPSR